MKRRQLLITKFSYDYSEIIKSLYPNGHVVWLQLWPVINTNDIKLLYPEIEIVKSTDLIKNSDHFKIARNVTDVSNNWWKILGLHSYDLEWNISGLKISKIFSYEIEQVLTNIYFRERAINYSIKKFNPDSLIFIDKEIKRIKCDDLLKKASNYTLYNFFKNKFKNIEIKQHILPFNLIPKNNNYNNKLKKIFRKKPSYYLRITKRKLLNFLPKNNGIVVSNSFRCIQPIEDFSTVNKRVYIHYDDYYLVNGHDNQLLSNIKYYENKNYSLIYDFFNSFLPYIETKFNGLKIFFKKTSLKINKENPKLYITVNIANSIEIVKFWAYYKNDVRSVWSSEGLGQPDLDLGIIINSVIRPEIDIERWVVSEFFSKIFYNNTKPVRITGYLDESINSYVKLKSKKQILFALSMANCFFKRAIVSEDIFEILESIKEISDVLSDFHDYKLIIKTHPGDNSNIPLYKTYLKDLGVAKIVSDINLGKLMAESKLVIVCEGSVALEALKMGKNVIWYNHTGRPNYISSIIKYLNHNPEKGNCIVEVKSKQGLKETIENLLMYSKISKRSSKLEYLLENAKENYNVYEKIKEAIL